MEIYPNAWRAKRALRRPLFIFVADADSSRVKALLKYPDIYPATPPKILRLIGVNWLKDKDVAYSVWVVVNKRASNTQRGTRDALQRLCRARDGRKYFRHIRLKNQLSHKCRQVVLLVQSDVILKLKQSSLVVPVAATKRFCLFDLEDLQTGSWATVG